MNPLQFLIDQGVLSEQAADTVQTLITEQGHSLESAVLSQGINADELRAQLAEYYQVPSFTLTEDFKVTQEVLDYLPEDSAMHYLAAPLYIEDGVLVVGAHNPDDLQLREALNFISSKHNMPYKLVFMLEGDTRKILNFYENLKGEVTDALNSLETELDAEIQANTEKTKTTTKEELEHIKEDAPVTKIVATILRYAVDGKASDIHIEPTETKVVVRYRMDGVLSTSLELPKKLQMSLVARVKILTSMRLDEKRKPQDGRFSATFDGRKIDFRVSILPVSNGEKVVMRILDNEKGVSRLEETGMDPRHIETIRRVLKEPYGIILISGPTGSGKSTTLYSMFGEVDRQSKNVLSLEDPVEYNIEGVSQSQVRPEIGYTFAQGLRAALRQDPDVIMVGEIRDKETAQLAIQAALTGHLVLSTIHTNNAIGVIPRLIDMGVDPFLIAPTLKLAIAQRLARRVKVGTGREESVTPSTRLMIDKAFASLPEKHRHKIPPIKSMLHPEPSPGSATGMQGRIAIMETLEVNEDIQELILRAASEEQIFTKAREGGFMTMQEDAIIKALEHTIPYEEMTAFGTKIGLEELPEDAETVDNPIPATAIEDIMKSDEDTSRR